MKIALRRSTPIQIVFAVIFNVLFFLPYFGQTHFRVDQFLGFVAIAVVAFRAMVSPIAVPTELGILFKWSLGIMIWAAVIGFVTPGKMIFALQFVNSFSCFAAGVALFILFYRQIQVDLRQFLLVSLIASIVLNAIAVYMWALPESETVAQLIVSYGGATDSSYGEAGTLGAVSFFGGRIPSLFPHTQAFAVYNLMILALTSYAISLARGWFGWIICFVAAFMSFVGGVLTASKTYTFCVILGMGFYMLLSIPTFLKRPRMNLYYLGLLVFLIAVGVIFYDQSRFLRDHIEYLVNFDVSGTFGTRVGDEGYLVKSGTVAAMLQPVALLLGLGGAVSDYAWSDNGYFQVLMYGGIGFFLFFYGYLGFLIYLLLRNLDELPNRYFLALYFALFLANAGTLLFLFPRAGLLLAFFTLVAIYHKSLVSQAAAPASEVV